MSRPHSLPERDRLLAVARAKLQRQREAEHNSAKLRAAMHRELIELAAVPETHQQYRERVMADLRQQLDRFCLRRLCSTDDHGFSYDRETLREFRAALEDAMEVLQQGTTLYDVKRHAARVQAIKAATAKADSGLQALLMAATVDRAIP